MWCFLTLCGFIQVACQGFLVRYACVRVLLGGLYFFSLECNEISSTELWDAYGFAVTLDCLCLGAQGCVPCCWRICLVCLALKLVGPCVVLGFSADMEAFDEFLSINIPWSQELPGVRVWT